MQGQIGDPGAARSASRLGGTGLGYRLLRQMILSPDFFGADKIRLTALPKSICSVGTSRHARIGVHFTFLGSPLNLTPNPNLNLFSFLRED